MTLGTHRNTWIEVNLKNIEENISNEKKYYLKMLLFLLLLKQMVMAMVQLLLRKLRRLAEQLVFAWRYLMKL